MNDVKNHITLLLTGTITPNSFDTLALKDPDVRRNQYIEAIKFYLSTTNLSIVFTENSGCSIENEFDNFKDKERLEFLTYKSEPTTPDKGKGAKELEIIHYAMYHSEFISDSDAIIKVTGRLKILNIHKLHKDFSFFNKNKKNLLACNIYKLTRMDSRCFFFTKDFWPCLETFGKLINLKYSFEQALWDSGLQYLRDGSEYKQFKRPLRVSGISGGFGTPYDDSPLIAQIKCVRHYFRAPYCYLKLKKDI
ncbi:hypothetical protein DFQ11_102709 [Winogradskyella epiphytica]|uniref:Uncharacterized protein n=1 Tax=Winogradskyella epiphytica TaxID=262005 RepID=A0A2V4Y141_9FLAO|nr:hypothetical protein [Winogradskyella epiphytica]PYE82128.1 hypothetical protein DFQ11_102709 [Winogradskyella epiphytica]